MLSLRRSFSWCIPLHGSASQVLLPLLPLLPQLKSIPPRSDGTFSNRSKRIALIFKRLQDLLYPGSHPSHDKDAGNILPRIQWKKTPFLPLKGCHTGLLGSTGRCLFSYRENVKTLLSPAPLFPSRLHLPAAGSWNPRLQARGICIKIQIHSCLHQTCGNNKTLSSIVQTRFYFLQDPSPVAWVHGR